MTRRDSLECVHEPFGEPFYYGPERMSERWMNDNEYRLKSGYANTTYKDVLDTILKVADEVRSFLFFFLPSKFFSHSFNSEGIFLEFFLEFFLVNSIPLDEVLLIG